MPRRRQRGARAFQQRLRAWRRRSGNCARPSAGRSCTLLSPSTSGSARARRMRSAASATRLAIAHAEDQHDEQIAADAPERREMTALHSPGSGAGDCSLFSTLPSSRLQVAGPSTIARIAQTAEMHRGDEQAAVSRSRHVATAAASRSSNAARSSMHHGVRLVVHEQSSQSGRERVLRRLAAPSARDRLPAAARALRRSDPWYW